MKVIRASSAGEYAVWYLNRERGKPGHGGDPVDTDPVADCLAHEVRLPAQQMGRLVRNALLASYSQRPDRTVDH